MSGDALLKLKRSQNGGTMPTTTGARRRLVASCNGIMSILRAKGGKLVKVALLCLVIYIMMSVRPTIPGYQGLGSLRSPRNQPATAADRSLPSNAIVSSWRFPREPNVTTGCSIKFQHTNMSLCYFLPYGANFGDELGPAAVKRILEYHFGCSAKDVHVIDMAPDPKRRHNRTCLFALGSIFHYVRTGDHVWGTGINPTHQGAHPEWLHVHSVRGPETERKMKEWYKYESVPHGDPGFLIPFLYQDYYHMPTKSIGVEPAYTVPQFCFIPHAQDLEFDEIKNPPPELKIISVKQHWEPMMEAIRFCDYVVSTSLHGIIIADALGIPSKWFQFNASLTQKTEGSFKYHDYLWSVGRTTVKEPDRKFSMAAFRRTSTYMKPLDLERRRALVTKFLSSFPYHLFRKSLTPNELPKVNSECAVSFSNPGMALCVPSNDEAGSDSRSIGVAVVKRLLENRFGCSTKSIPIVSVSERGNKKCLLTQGNLLEAASKGDHVWGAGSTSKKKAKVSSKDISVRSVRGPHSQKAIDGRLSADLSHGDPAFLLPYLHREYLGGEETSKEKATDTRFCYMADESSEEKQLSNALPANVDVVSVTLPPAKLLESLGRCDYVSSSSVNGLILADSLGLATLWIPQGKDSKQQHLWEVEDYFGATKRKVSTVKGDGFSEIKNQNLYAKPLSLDQREQIADETAASFPSDLFTTNQNKTLVVIMGNIRGGELAWKSLYENVLDVNMADLALVVGKTEPKSRRSSLYDRAKYLFEFPEFDDWADAIDQINGTSWRQTLLEYAEPTHGLFGAANGNTGSGAVIHMARWFVSQALDKYGWDKHYDRFMLTRSDHYYGCTHDLSLMDPQYIWVPQGQDFGGVTDRHMICNRGQFRKAIDIYPNAVRHPTKYVDQHWYVRNPEQMIARRWKEENLWDSLRRFDRVMFTCADDGDTTRWQVKSSKRAEEGVYLKYVEEYNQTKCVCSGKHWNEDGVCAAS